MLPYLNRTPQHHWREADAPHPQEYQCEALAAVDKGFQGVSPKARSIATRLILVEERSWLVAHLIRVIKHPGRQVIPQIWRYQVSASGP